MLVNFITYLHINQFSPATIATYMTAISYMSKLNGCDDHSTSFIVSKLLCAIQRKGAAPDMRLPIQLDLLHKLVAACETISGEDFIIHLLKAMFLLAFHALLRVSEFTTTDPSISETTLQLADCYFSKENNVIKSMDIHLKHFKGNTSRAAVVISIKKSGNVAHCPVRAMLLYLTYRSKIGGPLFIMPNKTAVTRAFFARKLSTALIHTSVENPSRFKSHSFRIGSATSMASKGLSDTEIQRMGRWNSNAFKRYIRIPSFDSK